MAIEITAKTQKEFREKLYAYFSSPYNRDSIRIRIARDRWNSGNNNIYRIDLTAIGKDREDFIGVMAYDDENKEFFFIEI